MSCSRLGQCGFSSQIVKLLTAKKIEFKSFNILEDEEVRQGLKVYSDWPTYPQLYAGGTLIGGLDVVKELIESGELENELKLATLETNANSVERFEKITASSIKNKNGRIYENYFPRGRSCLSSVLNDDSERPGRCSLTPAVRAPGRGSPSQPVAVGCAAGRPG